jgi:hypothetical protein
MIDVGMIIGRSGKEVTLASVYGIDSPVRVEISRNVDNASFIII